MGWRRAASMQADSSWRKRDRGNDMDYIKIPRRATNLTGQRFARLVVLGPIAKTVKNQIKWLCQCDCGGSTVTTISKLRSGRTKSCGCWRHESRFIQNMTHGKCRTRLYRVWRAMIDRCTLPRNANYPNYGARGISVCDLWLRDFQAFFDHVSRLDGFGIKGMMLDRVDTDGNYEPGNVRWATTKEQMRNKRNNRMIEFRGRTQCSAAWAEETGIGRSTIEWRLDNGWSAERALTMPAGRNRMNASRYLLAAT